MSGCERLIWVPRLVNVNPRSEYALTLTDVCAGYGSTTVLNGLSFTLTAGEAVSLIGRNGVGKTTLLATIMGHTVQHSGRVDLHGQEISALKPYQRVWQGLGYVPQEREIFPTLTVQENLAVAARGEGWTLEQVFELFPQLYERRRNWGTQLSGGEQQMLAIGRALVGNPAVLLLDEPSEGLAPVIVAQLYEVLNRLREHEQMTMILVEQNSDWALEFAERCLVMNRGQLIYDGASTLLQTDASRLSALVGIAGH